MFCCGSDGIVMLGYNVVGSLNISDKNISIFDLNSEFSFEGFMYLDSSLNINKSTLISKVSIERYWHSLHYLYNGIHSNVQGHRC